MVSRRYEITVGQPLVSGGFEVVSLVWDRDMEAILLTWPIFESSKDLLGAASDRPYRCDFQVHCRDAEDEKAALPLPQPLA